MLYNIIFIYILLTYNNFSGREEKFKRAFTGDSRGDANSPEFDRLHSQSLREGEKSLQLHNPLFKLLGDTSDDRRGGRALFYSCPILNPCLGSQ